MDWRARTETLLPRIQQIIEIRSTCVVAIDGADCAGKTTLARELSGALVKRGISSKVIHLDDTFKRETTRPRRNPDAASEFLLDFFDHSSLDTLTEQSETVVIVEGLFLLQPQFMGYYDLSIWLEIDEYSSFLRAYQRDISLFENWGDFALHHISQCLVGQRIFRSLCTPERFATFSFNVDASPPTGSGSGN